MCLGLSAHFFNLAHLSPTRSPSSPSLTLLFPPTPLPFPTFFSTTSLSLLPSPLLRHTHLPPFPSLFNSIFNTFHPFPISSISLPFSSLPFIFPLFLHSSISLSTLSLPYSHPSSFPLSHLLHINRISLHDLIQISDYFPSSPLWRYREQNTWQTSDCS